MAIVTSTESRAQHRVVYMPPETGMAHRSALSPDRKQVLLAEMDMHSWLPCRLVPFDGSSRGKPVGPNPSQCTDAAWSPDGRWMYFAADAGNGYHIWRQRFPNGASELITSGATEEEGVEIARDGHFFITSIGASQSTLWFHDTRGDRQITSEGFALLPSISPDGKKLFYLLRVQGPWHFVRGELWSADLESGQRQRLLPDFLIQHYSISADGRRIVFVASDDSGRSPVWTAVLDGRVAPRQVTNQNSRSVYFGTNGYVFIAGEEKGASFLYRVKEDGGESKKLPAVSNDFGVSPDAKWILSHGAVQGDEFMLKAYPVDGGAPKLICVNFLGHPSVLSYPMSVSWSPDAKYLYLTFQTSVYAIPLHPGQMLPPIPAGGFRSKEEIAALPGARLIPEPGAFPGPNPSMYAFTKVATHHNIYRVPVP